MEKLLVIHLINFAVQAFEQIHAIIVSLGHLVK
jgi:hypothetical protein